MGVRLSAYAVDLPSLNEFLEWTLTDVLCRYQRDGEKPEKRFTLIDVDSDDTFTALPQGTISVLKSGGSSRDRVVLKECEIGEIKVLQRSVREHLSVASIYQFAWLLDAFCECRGVGFIHRLLDGQRRWWIGSALQAASPVMMDEEYEELVLLFRKMLRGLNCGHRIPEHDPGFSTDRLPFAPPDDPDFRFGRWTEGEAINADRLISKLLLVSPIFTRMEGQIGIAPDDAEWHQWVYENLKSILSAGDLNYEQLNVLSFFG